ncbi:Ig-like domain-containing protein [Burkholderia aenigmatica]|uniref:Ig-like domain-containing protein n=1 Tax=Burkholderia aenigmatica TaxID=2015348 RepID=UPI0011778F8E|nr:Ig-like domain-containing protein [Burkholderia aenigmatica]
MKKTYVSHRVVGKTAAWALAVMLPMGIAHAAGPAVQLQAVAGDQVAVLEGSDHGPALRVRALAADGSPSANSVIQFRTADKKVITFGSRGDPIARATTDEQGYAEVQLGHLQSGPGKYSIHAETIAGAATPVTFSVFVAQATHISINSGANQTGAYTHTPDCGAGSGFYATPSPVSVRVTDDAGRPVAGVPISWSANLPNKLAMYNCTAFNNGSCVTDANGVNSGYPFLNYSYTQNGVNYCTTTFPSSYSLIANISGTGTSVAIPENLTGR